MNDPISRQAAINAFCKECYDTDGEICDRDDVCGNVMILKALPSAQPEERTEKRTETHACDYVKRQATKHLDLFTKTYCRDKSVKDDLVFRCNQCDFQLPDGTCLAKTMARKLCPDCREFGSMGDL